LPPEEVGPPRHRPVGTYVPGRPDLFRWRIGVFRYFSPFLILFFPGIPGSTKPHLSSNIIEIPRP